MTGPRPPGHLRPANVVRALADLLRADGITRVYGNACTMLGVLSIACGLTVWTDGRRLWWDRDGHQTTWPAADPDGAARLLAALARNQPTGPPHSDGP
jgi:hypothetical protein